MEIKPKVFKRNKTRHGKEEEEINFALSFSGKISPLKSKRFWKTKNFQAK
jgi:hypothetical protein